MGQQRWQDLVVRGAEKRSREEKDMGVCGEHGVRAGGGGGAAVDGVLIQQREVGGADGGGGAGPGPARRCDRGAGGGGGNNTKELRKKLNTMSIKQLKRLSDNKHIEYGNKNTIKSLINNYIKHI